MNHKFQLKIFVLASALILASAVFNLIAFSHPAQYSDKFADEIWLPSINKTVGFENKLILPIFANAEIGLYGPLMKISGRGVNNKITSAMPINIFEGRANPWLKPENCPNIEKISEILPSRCNLIGTVNGAEVFAISRSLPRGDYEVYTQFGSTVIYFNLYMSDQEYAMKYLETFHKLDNNALAKELANNGKNVKSLADQYSQKYKTLATRLPFDFILPTYLPKDWQPSSDPQVGPDLEEPNIQKLTYFDSSSHVVSILVLAPKDFDIAACGPIPGEQAELECKYNSEQKYYYANMPGYQYTFRNVGNAVAIIGVNFTEQDYDIPDKALELSKIVADISSSLSPVERQNIPEIVFVTGLGD